MSLVQMTLAGGVFILFIVVVRVLALHRLPKAAFLALWEMAALRLLLPFTIPLPFSVLTPIEHLTAAGGVPVPAPSNVGTSGTLAPAGTASGPALTLIWLAGAALTAVYFAVLYLRARQRFRASVPVATPAVREWLATRSLRRPLEVRQSDQVSSPLTYDQIINTGTAGGNNIFHLSFCQKSVVLCRHHGCTFRSFPHVRKSKFSEGSIDLTDGMVL